MEFKIPPRKNLFVEAFQYFILLERFKSFYALYKDDKATAGQYLSETLWFTVALGLFIMMMSSGLGIIMWSLVSLMFATGRADRDGEIAMAFLDSLEEELEKIKKEDEGKLK